MESKYTFAYDVAKSAERIDSILNESDTSFEDLTEIPERDKLTFTNGFYINVGAIFVDIRESTGLANEHRRPKLAKLYRCYISEIVAILNSYVDCKEIDITGDCVAGIFNANLKTQIRNMINAAAQINSLIKILNYKFSKSDIVNIQVGIGIAYGRSLMIKAGYSGSKINDVVWMGDVLNSSSNICNKDNNNIILIDSTVHYNLTDEMKEWFSYNDNEGFYEGNVGNSYMENWYKENCK